MGKLEGAPKRGHKLVRLKLQGSTLRVPMVLGAAREVPMVLGAVGETSMVLGAALEALMVLFEVGLGLRRIGQGLVSANMALGDTRLGQVNAQMVPRATRHNQAVLCTIGSYCWVSQVRWKYTTDGS
ncbi:unnamed protein product [Ilex paraguariensis]|uniref:Uncharacterized protein n=1 Tax=Ilex paraguariensis TaxID=185542 RepID=A0ABC8RR42_9AQUA